MSRMVWLAAFAGLVALTGCEPAGDVDPAKKAYHKSNRDAYLYQGI